MGDRHVSVTHNVSDIKLVTCEACCNGGSESYHCPLCLPSIFKPTQKRPVQQHLQTHYENRVTYNDIHMLPCQLDCVKTKPRGQRGHFHCPFCDVTRSRRESILDHVRNCESNPDTSDAKEPRDSELLVSNDDINPISNKCSPWPGGHEDPKEAFHGNSQETDSPGGAVMGAGGDQPQVRKRGRPPKKRPGGSICQPTGSGDSASRITTSATPSTSEVSNISVTDVGPTCVIRKRGRPPKNAKVLIQRENQSSLPQTQSQSVNEISESNSLSKPRENMTNDDKEKVGNILVSLSEGKLELAIELPMEASDNSVSSKVFTAGAGQEIEDLHQSNNTPKLDVIGPRVSRRLAVKRESGQNFVWEALMKSVRGEQLTEASVDDTPRTKISQNKESPKKLLSRTQVTFPETTTNNIGVAKRGRGRPRKRPLVDVSESSVLQGSTKEELRKVCQTMEGIMSKNDPESSEIFSQAAAVISGSLLRNLSVNKEGLITDIAVRAGVSLSSPDGASYFLHGSLEGLLTAKEMLSKLQTEQVITTTAMAKGLQPAESNVQSPEVLAESSVEEEEGRLAHKEAENLSQQDEVVSMAVNFHVDSNEENPDDNLRETELVELDDSSLNPSTGRRYSRLCAMYRNPDLAHVVCDLCGFRSTANGIQKHKQRLHPERLHLCECCGRTFGVRYDMRRHRLKHFDSDGKMLPDALEVYKTYHPELSGEVVLKMIEAGLDGEDSSHEDMREGGVEESEEMEGGAPSKEMEKEGSDGSPADVDTETSERVLEQDEPSQDNNSGQQEKSNEIAFPPRVKVANSLAKKNPGKALYLCDQCGFRSSLAGLNKHKHRHHPQLVFCCSLCDVKFGIVNDMLRHYKTHENNTKVYTIDDVKENAACGMCDFSGNEKTVKSHLVEQHQTTSVTCTHCEATFTSQRMLQIHFRMVHPKLFKTTLPAAKVKHRLPRDEGRKVCNVCGARIRTSWFAYHMKTHNRVTLVCDECGFSTVKRFEMKSHMKVKHSPAQYICHICGQTFTLPHSHKTHMRSKHSDTPPAHACDECGKVFTDRRFLTTHYKRMHLKEKKFFCDICGKGFFEKIRMKEHRTIHTSEQEREAQKTLECKYCGRRFRKAQQLSQHENTHTGNRPYKCKLCGKGYAWASEIHKHMRTHTDERPFQCTECGRSFKFRYKLATHMITHTRKSRHMCNLCGKVFTVLSTLKRHRCKMALPSAQGSVQGSAVTMIDLAQIASTSAQVEENENEAPTQVYIQAENEEAVMAGESLLHMKMEGTEGTEGEAQELITYMCGLCRQLFETPQEINDHIMYEHSDSVTVIVEAEENTNMSEVVMATTDSEEGIVAHLKTIQGHEEDGYCHQPEVSEHGLLEQQIGLVQEAVEVEQNEVNLEGASDDPANQQIILVQNVEDGNAETVIMEDIGQEITHVLLEHA